MLGRDQFQLIVFKVSSRVQTDDRKNSVQRTSKMFLTDNLESLSVVTKTVPPKNKRVKNRTKYYYTHQ